MSQQCLFIKIEVKRKDRIKIYTKAIVWTKNSQERTRLVKYQVGKVRISKIKNLITLEQ